MKHARFWRVAGMIVSALCCITAHAADTPATPSAATDTVVRMALPPRPDGALTGSQLAKVLSGMDLPQREARVVLEFLAGNVPPWLRELRPLQLRSTNDGHALQLELHVTPDYLALGSADDFLRIPLTPATAQRLADTQRYLLPTRKIVDAIYAQAELKLTPEPMKPGPEMTTIPSFTSHNALVNSQLMARASSQPLGRLVAGHKKDVVLSNRLTNAPGKVAIYGWHQTNGVPIQPPYTGHTARWVDYSHGIRLVCGTAQLDGTNIPLASVMSAPALSELVSDEGPLAFTRYPIEGLTAAEARLETTNTFGERVTWLGWDPEVRIQINRPLKAPNGADQSITNALLILYALPNGNSIEQTVGRAIQPGDDMRFGIQHIGAQTRFLRALLPDQEIIIAYLEAQQRAWPTWRKKNGDTLILKLIDYITTQVGDNRNLQIILNGHSGGGSLIFGYLNAVDAIPANILRIAFLDSNYAYNSAAHYPKLKAWLNGSIAPSLCILAYDDANALLNGKSFVSAQGGTWGRSQLMLQDFLRDYEFESDKKDGLRHYSALSGRIQFFLKENPERKILHTVQVELNGFIHSVLTGTALQEKGYSYLGARGYDRWIEGADSHAKPDSGS
jgi:hypothetical protein